MEKYGGQWGLTGQWHSLKYNIEMYTETGTADYKSCNKQAETVENHNWFTTYEYDYLSRLSMPYLSVQAQ